MCSTHLTLSCRILPFSLPTTNNFFKYVYSEITGESAWRVLYRPPWCCLLLWQLKVIRIGHYDSGLLMSRTFLSCAGSSCTLFFCLYLLSCTQKMCWREHSLADTVPLFSTILQFSLNWVKTEVLVCSVCALYEFVVLAYSIRLLYFHVCFPVFSPFVYNCCVMDRTYHSHKSCHSTLAPLRHHSSRMLTSHFSNACLPLRAHGMPLLALIGPQSLTFLSSNGSANLTLL